MNFLLMFLVFPDSMLGNLLLGIAKIPERDGSVWPLWPDEMILTEEDKDEHEDCGLDTGEL